MILRSTAAVELLPVASRQQVTAVLIASYNQRTRVLIGFTAAQFIAVAMLWRKPQVSFYKGNVKMKEVIPAGDVEGSAAKGE